MKIELFGTSDIGRKRETNQDAYKICGFDGRGKTVRGLCVVADGMGGHKAGEVASRETVEGLSAAFESGAFSRNPEGMVKSIEAVNIKIFSESAANEGLSGMGTTVVAGYLLGERLYVANVGDSRCYMIRSGEKITQITVDHSIIEEHIAAGNITREEAAVHPQRHMITRAVGSEETVKVDLFETDVHSGDIFLFCTDGLTEMVKAEEILKIMMNEPDLTGAVNNLVFTANKNGGLDNITVVAMKII